MPHPVSYVTRKLAIYLCLSAFLGGAYAWLWWLYENKDWPIFLAGTVFFLTVVMFSTAILEAYHLFTVYRNAERDRIRDEERYDAQAEYLRAEAKLFEYANALARNVVKMTPAQLKVAVQLSPVFFEFMNMEESGRKYTMRQAEAVILHLSETEYGFTYLPRVSDYPEGSVQYRVVKGVTDDLMLLGKASRTHSTARARLEVTQREAFSALFKGEDE
jgi:hypothetical protein